MTETVKISCPHPAGGTVSTVCEGFQRTASMRPDVVALRTPGGKQEITWRQYAERVRKLTAGLSSLGVKRGDTIGIMLTNRPEFHLADTAALHVGATPFSIYNTSAPEQIEYLFGNAENTVVFTEKQFLATIKASGAKLEHIICVDGPVEGTKTLEDVEAAGADDFDFDASWKAVEPGDVATLIYTSGTTGPPKGVEITHSNLIAEVATLVPILEVGPDDRIASYLPSAHIADRVAGHYANLIRGVQITSVNDPKAIAEALPDVRPTVFFGVPRLWQKIKAGIETKLATEATGIKQKLAYWAIETGQQAAHQKLTGKGDGGGVKHALADKLVLSKLRHALGMDQVRWAASGAAAIPPSVLEYFHGLGIPVYEVWGMSETTGVSTTNAEGAIKIGAVGKAVGEIEVKLGEDGELFVRGPVIMRGYRKQPDKTAETIDSDGWLATGDIAEIDNEGFVKIVDRKKELIINEAGKNMSPTNIENSIKAASSLVGQAVAIGDGKPYISALIVLDPDAAAARGSKLGMSDTSIKAVSERQEIRDEIAKAVKEGNAKLSRVEQIKRFIIVGREWEPGGAELTPTLKLKRKPIAEKYKAEIDALYATSPGAEVIDLR